jgi:hypothetical protein
LIWQILYWSSSLDSSTSPNEYRTFTNYSLYSSASAKYDDLEVERKKISTTTVSSFLITWLYKNTRIAIGSLCDCTSYVALTSRIHIFNLYQEAIASDKHRSPSHRIESAHSSSLPPFSSYTKFKPALNLHLCPLSSVSVVPGMYYQAIMLGIMYTSLQASRKHTSLSSDKRHQPGSCALIRILFQIKHSSVVNISEHLRAQ